MALMVEGIMRSRDLRLWRPRAKPKQQLNYGDQSQSGNEKENENESRRIRRAISEQQRHILEAIAKGGGGNYQEVTTYKGEDGKVRMKILVKKQDLKQILDAAAAAEAAIINCNNQKQEEDHTHPSSSSKSSSSIIEQRLHHLMMSRKSRSSRRRRPSASANAPWTPALHSIPEEPVLVLHS